MLTLRKHKISRLEEFSDAVFGFALTLLVVSSVVPRSYEELLAVVRGIPSFAFCFALIVWIWHEHDSYFGRYPLSDTVTVLLNSALLFVVLLYVYALKFMFDAFMFQVFGLAGMSRVEPMTLIELRGAFALYGIGFCVLMVLFAGLYRHAYRKREELGLSALQAFDARAFAGHHLVSSAIGLILAAWAWFGPLPLIFLSPAAFALMGPGHWGLSVWMNRRRALVVERSGTGNVSPGRRRDSVEPVNSVEPV